MDFQDFPPFLGTKYSDFIHFHHQCGCSVLYEKYSRDPIFGYLETSMAPTILLTETPPTNTLSHNIALSEFPILESTKTTQDTTTTPYNATSVSWSTLSHQKLTNDPTIYGFTRKYCDACKNTVNIAESCF